MQSFALERSKETKVGREPTICCKLPSLDGQLYIGTHGSVCYFTLLSKKSETEAKPRSRYIPAIPSRPSF
jgi:hypothetical protein